MRSKGLRPQQLRSHKAAAKAAIAATVAHEALLRAFVEVKGGLEIRSEKIRNGFHFSLGRTARGRKAQPLSLQPVLGRRSCVGHSMRLNDRYETFANSLSKPLKQLEGPLLDGEGELDVGFSDHVGKGKDW
ncbi:MAG TPA: hypothetical protein PLA50_07475, partial [Bacteroidia bacterium]|nr:hypothetical protein [Bacteroidia bacterium]